MLARAFLIIGLLSFTYIDAYIRTVTESMHDNNNIIIALVLDRGGTLSRYCVLELALDYNILASRSSSDFLV